MFNWMNRETIEGLEYEIESKRRQIKVLANTLLSTRELLDRALKEYARILPRHELGLLNEIFSNVNHILVSEEIDFDSRNNL